MTEHGKIHVGNAELSDKNIAEVQNHIAAVWQDSYIFYGSCMDNIRIGNPNASDEEVYQAEKKANIHDFILQLENGYDTILGERGAYHIATKCGSDSIFDFRNVYFP